MRPPDIVKADNQPGRYYSVRRADIAGQGTIHFRVVAPQPDSGGNGGRIVIEQKHWRWAGVGTIGAAVVMAAAGARWHGLSEAPLLFMAWWGAVVALLGVSVLIALLDIRYIRLRYVLEKRQAFLETLGDRTLQQRLNQHDEAGDGAGQSDKDPPPPTN
jgi:hypothetical protein